VKKPSGLRRCPVCGEYRNRARNVLCWCDALTCAVCGEGKIRKPISDHWDPADAKLWHSPWFTGLKRCDVCGASAVKAWRPTKAAA
jgi:hypothetical protein